MTKQNDQPRYTWKKLWQRTGKLSCVLLLAGTIGSQVLTVGSGTLSVNLPINWPQIQVHAAEKGPKIVKRDESYITSGAKLVEYRWTNTDGTKTRSTDVRVIEIDLHNPHVELNVMTGQNGKIATRNT